MQDFLKDRLIASKKSTVYDIAYPICVTGWEIRQVQGFNKLYIRVFLQKLHRDVKAAKIKIASMSQFGEVLSEDIHVINDITLKPSNFFAIFPVDVDARDAEPAITQCVYASGQNVIDMPPCMAVPDFVPFKNEPDRIMAKKLIPSAQGYSREIKGGWICCCGTLNIADCKKCVRCNAEKEEVLSLISEENIAARRQAAAERAEQIRNERAKREEQANVLLNSMRQEQAAYEERARREQTAYEERTLREREEAEKHIQQVLPAQEVQPTAEGKIIGPWNSGKHNDYKKTALKKNDKVKSGKRKRRTKIVIIIVACVAAVAALFCTAFFLFYPLDSLTVDGMVFEKNDNGTYTLTNYIGSDSEVEIPSDIRGVEVTEVSSFAFSDCTTLISVTIPESINYINRRAFVGCDLLTSATFENTESWFYVSRVGVTTGGMRISSSSLANPTTAATYLTTNYLGYYWYRL